MNNIKVALFDLDGVVIDTEPQYSIVWNWIGEHFGTGIENFGAIIKGMTLTNILNTYFPDKSTHEQIEKTVYEYEKTMPYEYMKGARDFILDLRNHDIRTAVVTSSDHAKMRNLYNYQPEIKTLFDKILTAEDFHASKPDPDCYLRGAAAFGADISECLCFEDSINGLKAGMGAGIYTIGLATTNPREKIAPLCNYVIDDFSGFSFQSILELQLP